MKKSTLAVIISVAIPALGVSQTTGNPEAVPSQAEEALAAEQRQASPNTAPPGAAPEETLAEKAEAAAAAAQERAVAAQERAVAAQKQASEVLERGKAKSDGNDESAPGPRQPPAAGEPAEPETESDPVPVESAPAADAVPPTAAPEEMPAGKAKAAAAAAQEQASEALERARAKSAGKGKSAPGTRQSATAGEPAGPEAAPTRPGPGEALPQEAAPRAMAPRGEREAPVAEAEVEAEPERPSARRPPSSETARALEDRGRRDRRTDAATAETIESPDEAQRLIGTILGSEEVGAVSSERATTRRGRSERREAYRPPVEEVGRTQLDREQNVVSIVSRFEGSSTATVQTSTQHRHQVYRDRSGREYSESLRAPRYYSGNRRVVRYSSRSEIPPVLIAYHRLNRVEVLPVAGSPYAHGFPDTQQAGHYTEIPRSYLGGEAHAVAYTVDPDSVISRDDILFRVNSTEFADAYSFDLVLDIAEAINASSLINESFVIEGHASAEGNYGRNLALSQERAERISRDLVYYGVSPDRLLPVGYGITEAVYPANAPEDVRRLDRRVMVFRMQQ